MTRLFSISETLSIDGHETTILKAVQEGADVHTRITFTRTSDGIRPDRHIAVVTHDQHVHEFDISVMDFLHLRGLGVLTENVCRAPAAHAA
jgi:hypothetical protein